MTAGSDLLLGARRRWLQVAAPTKTEQVAATRSRVVERVAAQVLFALSLMIVGFFVFVFFLSALPQARAQSGLQRRFARPLAYGQVLVGGHIPAGTPVARLDIPALGLHQIVVEGTTADDLRYGPGHLSASPLPGQTGNAVIAAHRLAWGGPFRHIGSLEPGTRIDVTTGQGHFVYVVTGTGEEPSRDVAPLEASTDNRLTLLTAADLGASRRTVVLARLLGAPDPSPSGRTSVVSGADSALAGQGGITLELMLWFELLVVVAIASVLVYRRLPRTSSYLITTPVLLGVLWIVYENMARTLPATL